MDEDKKELVEEVKETKEETPEQNNPTDNISFRDKANKLYQDKNGIEAREEIITDEMLKGQDLNMFILIATGIVFALFILYLIFGKTNVVKNLFNKQNPQQETELKELIDNNVEYGIISKKELPTYSTPSIVSDSCTTKVLEAISWNYCLDNTGNAINVYSLDSLFGDVIIPSSFDGHKVISVGMYNSNKQMGLCTAKANCKSVTSVTVPDGVIYVERYFLANASGVQKVTLPNSIKYIGEYAFFDAPNIASINSDEVGTFNMPNDLEYYGTHLFVYNKYVTNFTFPERIDYINGYTFDNCNTFKKLVIKGQYKYIFPGAFANNDKLTSLTFEDGVLAIAGFANNTSLKEVYISDSVKYIYTKTFANDGAISKLEYNDKLYYLGTNIFGDAKLDINDFITLKNLNLPKMDEDEKNEKEKKKNEQDEKEKQEKEELKRKAEEEYKKKEEQIEE